MPQREKDHQSAMEKSTVHGEPKKDGAGGKYTWGSPSEAMDPKDVPLDEKDPMNDHGESEQAKQSAAAKAAKKRPSETSKQSHHGRVKAPQNNEHNFPDLGAHGSHTPEPTGAWKKP